MKKTTEAMFDLLDQLAPYGVPAQYLLFDSWYAYPKVILGVLKRNINVVCILKAMPKVFYQYMDKSMNLTGLFTAFISRPNCLRLPTAVTWNLSQHLMRNCVRHGDYPCRQGYFLTL